MSASGRKSYFKSYLGQDELGLADVNQLYYEGHTMQFWAGVLPKDDKAKKEFWDWLKRAYHSYNITQEGVDHYVNALVGQDFTYRVEGQNSTEAEEILRKWWKWQKKASIKQALSHGEPIKDAVVQMLVRDRGDGSGVGYLRLFQPEKYQSFSGEQSYKKYVLHAPCASSISITRDDDNFIQKIEHSYGGHTFKYKLRNDGQCEITKNGEPPVLVALGGRFPIFPLYGKCLITDDTKQIQNSINHALTMKGVNIATAGFRERYILNAQPQGRYKPDPQNPGRWKFEKESDAKINLGAASVTQLTGNPIGPLNSPTGYTNPDVIIADPVDIKVFADSVHLDCETFYYHFALAHLLSAGDGNVSGKSRTAIQKDYVSNLHGYKDNIEAALSNAMEVMLIHLEPEKFSEIEITTTLTLSFDLIPEMVTMYATMIEKGLICKATAMKKLGNPDAQRELEKILEERKQEIDRGFTRSNFVEDYQPI